MRATLRRSCDACARAKHSCDLRTPRCSRCLKRNCPCIYANEPLTSSSITGSLSSTRADAASHQHAVEEPPVHVAADIRTPTSLSGPMVLARGNIDPFDSYPQTRLPRARVQRLIHHCMPRPVCPPSLCSLPSSPFRNRLPVVSLGPQPGIESFSGLLVAKGAGGASLIPCVVADCMSRRRIAGSTRIPHVGDAHDGLRVPCPTKD